VKVFAYEHITGGGLAEEALSSSLAHEGEMMSQALLADLAALQDVEVITLRDARLPPLDLPLTSFAVGSQHELDDLFEHCVGQADAAWLVAPESGGILESLSRRVVAGHRILLGSRPDAVHIAGSKLHTTRMLAQAGTTVCMGSQA
jgi:tyramine---L-glutamate ligase